MRRTSLISFAALPVGALFFLGIMMPVSNAQGGQAGLGEGVRAKDHLGDFLGPGPGRRVAAVPLHAHAF
eukprot:2670939-Pyramimonas_sp.AAC.2